MKRIYTGIDIGSDTIKIVTNEVIKNKVYCLAATSVPVKGVKKGWVIDSESVIASLKSGLKEMEEMLGVKIDQAIVTIPSYNRELTITSGETEITGEEGKVGYEDIIKCLQDAILGRVPEGRELVTISPIAFHIDDSEGVKNPIDQIGLKLSVKAVIATVPKENVQNMLNVMKACGVETVDIAFGETGDYYEARNRIYDASVGAVINIGYETTKVSVYNKGIMIKDEILDLGAKNVDKDIRYVYHVDKRTARYLKENFAVSNKRYADVNDTIEVMTKNGEKLTLNQLELSEVVEARITEILRLAKKQINILTNREISYIIITGGISELAGFQYVLDNVLGRDANTLNITTMGIRNNKYSSAAGITKYFHEKLELRGKSYSMFSEKKSVDLVSPKKHKAEDTTSDTIISKVFGYFFDNN